MIGRRKNTKEKIEVHISPGEIISKFERDLRGAASRQTVTLYAHSPSYDREPTRSKVAKIIVDIPLGLGIDRGLAWEDKILTVLSKPETWE